MSTAVVYPDLVRRLHLQDRFRELIEDGHELFKDSQLHQYREVSDHAGQLMLQATEWFMRMDNDRPDIPEFLLDQMGAGHTGVGGTRYRGLLAGKQPHSGQRSNEQRRNKRRSGRGEHAPSHWGGAGEGGLNYGYGFGDGSVTFDRYAVHGNGYG